MSKEPIKVSRSKALAIKTVYAALSVLKDHNGELPLRDVLAEVEKKLQIDEWGKERYEKTGNVRWQSILHFYSVDSVKAGFLVKKNSKWYLTQEGEAALKLGETGLFNAASEAYKRWRKETTVEGAEEKVIEEGETADQEMTVESVEPIAMEGIKKYINAKNPYEFQDLCAALLRGMGYYTPFVAPRGKDGGVDIMAYRDPLGTVSPRIKIQIKHRESSASVQEIRQLMGILQKDGDVGIFISTGGFTPDAKTTARGSHVHVELIDLDRFIGLWQEFYSKLTDEDKSRLPLLPVYFLAPAI